jgi:hypothetical protein
MQCEIFNRLLIQKALREGMPGISERDILSKKLLRLSPYIKDLVLTKVRQRFLNF